MRQAAMMANAARAGKPGVPAWRFPLRLPSVMETRQPISEVLSVKLSHLVFLFLIGSFLSGQAADPVAPPKTPPAVPSVPSTPATPPADPAKFELYLLVGQSNMAGRAKVLPEDQVADPHVLVLNREDKWVTQGEPIHYDSPKTGVGPGYTFGKLMAARKPGVIIGLIPCAFGGTSLQKWSPESREKRYPPDNLYQNAIRRTKIAMQSGTLKGILWHQGEANSVREADAKDYAAGLAKLIGQFRADLNAPTIPFIVGEIGYFNYTSPKLPFAQKVNEQIDTVPQLVPFCALVSAKDLEEKGDHLHFGNKEEKELAQRYLDAILQMQNSPAAAKP